MRFRLSLIVVSTLLFATSCNNKTKITDNKVDLEVTVGGVRVTTDINSKKEAEELEKQIEALTQQIEALRSQLAAKDTLLADEIKKLHEQMESLMEQNQKLTGR
ncbi:MAG TPA: hypothetical protein VER76_20235, partial [Pyrinomonadaceae bacterium]|nr:hypothetical protein [Pyrinomonadaceae bacterium]